MMNGDQLTAGPNEHSGGLTASLWGTARASQIRVLIPGTLQGITSLPD